MIDSKCSNCKVSIKINPYRLRFKNVFCNRICQAAFGRLSFSCEGCGKECSIRRCHRKQKRSFCSMLCYNTTSSNKEKIINNCLICDTEIVTHTWRNQLSCSKKCLSKIKSSQKINYKNPAWKDNDVGYNALHMWVKRRLPKTKLCKDCNTNPPRDLANISQKYKRDISDWEWLCRRCHMIKDGRMKKLHPKHEYKIMPTL